MFIEDDDMKRSSVKIWNGKDGLLFVILDVLDANKSSIELNIL